MLPRKQWELREFLIAGAAKQARGPGERLRREPSPSTHWRSCGTRTPARPARRADPGARQRSTAPATRDIRDSAGREVRASSSEGGPVIAYDPRDRGCWRRARFRDAIRWNDDVRGRARGVAKIGDARRDELCSCRLPSMEPAVHRITILAPQPPTIWHRLETDPGRRWEPADRDDAFGEDDHVHVRHGGLHAPRAGRRRADDGVRSRRVASQFRAGGLKWRA